MIQRVDFRALAELRYRIRVFVSFSEHAARAHGIEPRQHQLLLAVKGLPDDQSPTVRVLSERLQLRHHSVVELIDRLEARGLAQRTQSHSDRRVALVTITARGERLLRTLSVAHQSELQSAGPALAQALHALLPKRATNQPLSTQRQTGKRRVTPRTTKHATKRATKYAPQQRATDPSAPTRRDKHK